MNKRNYTVLPASNISQQIHLLKTLFIKKHILFLACYLFLSIIKLNAQSWSLSGNSATNTTNFLGTTDDHSLIFKTKNSERMRILSNGRIGIGVTNPLQKLHVMGNINIDSGFALYMSNHQVLKVDSSHGNTFLGNGIAVNILGTNNTVSGFQALHNNLYGSSNTASGYQALYSNVGSLNTATGAYALYSNSFNYGNTAMGYAALYSNTGSYNTASGVDALHFNTAGSFNVAEGNAALLANLTGSYNTASGYGALYSNSTGYYNAAVGYLALYRNYDAQNNAAIGSLAGASPHGWNNTFIGAGTDVTSPDIYNATALGNNVLVTSSNQVRIGNSFVSSIGGFANWTNISDGRVKKNIKENVPGLAFINKLKPVTYNLDLDAADKLMQRPVVKDNEGKMLTNQFSLADLNGRNAKQQIVYTGFVAQDVEKTAEELNYHFSGVDAPENDKDLYGLRYSEFVVPLVKAVQELSRMNKDKDARLDSMQNQINELKAMLHSASTGDKQSTIDLSSASLEQNIPNPVTNATRIHYYIPAGSSKALLNIIDNNGNTVKHIPLNGNGKGHVDIDASALNAAMYSYTLIVNGKIIDAKKMIIAR
jgi:hypothetical protein